MTKTKNYNLNQWEPADPIRRTDFNADNAAIDAALAGNAKALSDYKTANDAAVARKADKTALAALEQSVDDDLAAQSQQLGGEIAALAAALGSGGSNCRVTHGSYVGNGKSGKSDMTGVETGFKPVLLVLYGGVKCEIRMRRDDGMCKDYDFDSNESTSKFNISWEDTGVHWYSTINTSFAAAAAQANTDGTTYYYAVFGFDLGGEDML